MGCKTLFIGGIKSGKSKNAEVYTLKHSTSKPTYLATTEFFDDEMIQRIDKHKTQRKDNFVTLEEPLYLVKSVKESKFILIECMSMWINNMLYHNFTEANILDEIDNLLKLDIDMVFVINDVSCSVVSEYKLVRKFVDINGKVSQLLASKCDEVYNTVAGISIKIK